MKIHEIRNVAKDGEKAQPCGCGADEKGEVDKLPCCGPPATTGGGTINETVPGFLGWLTVGTRRVPCVATELTRADRLGAWKTRWGIGRMHYIIPPGLYAIGTPGPDDPVVVTANYKMSFDLVRQAMAGRKAWLLILETFGVNVWCAAGKGTFGTNELVRRIEATGLAQAVSHRRLLLPILGASGVAAHEVQRHTGFEVSYATMRAADLSAYLDNGMVATPAMRELTFTFRERLVLVPVEVVLALKPTVVVGAALFLLAALHGGISAGLRALAAYAGAVLAGVAIAPLLLPWLPGPSFAVKGALIGVAWCTACYFIAGGAGWHGTTSVAMFLALPAVSAFYTLNFTGCTTFTSRTGVKKELRLAIPAMGSALIISALLVVAGYFL